MSILDVENFTPDAKQKDFKKQTGENWLDFEEPRIAPVMGMRGSGKGGLMDYMAQQYYDQHFTVLHIWSARSLENLYWVVNKNCKIHFGKIKQLLNNKWMNNDNRLYPSEEEKYFKLAERGGFVKQADKGWMITQKGIDLIYNRLLYCKCARAIPILLVVPDYVDFDIESIDRFNGWYWKDIEEYGQHLSEITTGDKQLLQNNRLQKPSYLRPKPLIKIKTVTIPTTKEKKEKFHRQWTEAVLATRDEHRVLVITPLMFEGMDKFEVVAEIFKYHTKLTNSSGHFKPLTEEEVGKPYKYWPKRKKNWHKIAIFMNEARSVTPSSKMHGETGAGKSKRGVFDLVPEMRHMKTWYHTDFQNPSDIYDGIRPQSDFVIIKRTSPNLAGGDWKWFFDKIERDRFGFMRKRTLGRCDDIQYLRSYEKKFPIHKEWIDQRRPRISELPSNKAYIVYQNNEFRLIANKMGRFHHKLSLEDAMLDTGIRWTVNRQKKQEVELKTKKEMKLESKQKKEMKQLVFNKMSYLREIAKKDWPDVLDDLIQMESDGLVSGFDFHTRDNKWCSDRYRNWKKIFQSDPE